jgi:hypothetical protein
MTIATVEATGSEMTLTIYAGPRMWYEAQEFGTINMPAQPFS